jgi:hypothetical protein
LELTFQNGFLPSEAKADATGAGAAEHYRKNIGFLCE